MPTPKESLTAAIDSWNAGDLDGYLALYDDGIRLHGYTPEAMDKDEVRAFYDTTMTALDGPQLELHELLWHDVDKCSIRFTLTGKHVGEYLGVPATGIDIAMACITIMHFSGDRVVERWSQADMLGLLVQLGAVPAPA
jgi:predicted ester cyclase